MYPPPKAPSKNALFRGVKYVHSAKAFRKKSRPTESEGLQQLEARADFRRCSQRNVPQLGAIRGRRGLPETPSRGRKGLFQQVSQLDAPLHRPL